MSAATEPAKVSRCWVRVVIGATCAITLLTLIVFTRDSVEKLESMGEHIPITVTAVTYIAVGFLGLSIAVACATIRARWTTAFAVGLMIVHYTVAFGILVSLALLLRQSGA